MTEHRGAITRGRRAVPVATARARLPRHRATRARPCRARSANGLLVGANPVADGTEPHQRLAHGRWRRLDAGRYGPGRRRLPRGLGHARSNTCRAGRCAGSSSRTIIPTTWACRRWLSQKHGAAVWMSPFAHASVVAIPGVACPKNCASRTNGHFQAHGMEIVLGGVQQSPRGRDDSWFTGVPPLARGCADGDELIAAGRSWRLIETDGHCRGHLCLHDAPNDVLISGDQVLPTISPNVSVITSRPDGDPLHDFLALAGAARTGLRRRHAGAAFAWQAVSWSAPPHRQSCARITCEQLDLLREACREPRAAFECVPVMFGRVAAWLPRFPGAGRNTRAPALSLARRRDASVNSGPTAFIDLRW